MAKKRSIVKKSKKQLLENSNNHYAKNHTIIVEAMAELIDKGQGLKFPTNKQIAEYTGLNENTVATHLRDYDWSIDKRKYRKLNDLIAMRNFKYALKEENVSDRRLWYQMFGDLQKNGNNVLIQNIQKINLSDLSDEQLRKIASGEFSDVLRGVADSSKGGDAVKTAEIIDSE